MPTVFAPLSEPVQSLAGLSGQLAGVPGAVAAGAPLNLALGNLGGNDFGLGPFGGNSFGFGNLGSNNFGPGNFGSGNIGFANTGND
ncbi:hypothetical protein, partial [Mycobacterium kansasii]